MPDDPPRFRKPWEEHEIRSLKLHYQTRGAAWCAKRLGRSIGGVWQKAGEIVVRTEDRKGQGSTPHMTITEAGVICNAEPAQVWDAAKREGVVVRRHYRSLIPERWVYEYAERLKRWRGAEELGWYGRTEIQRIFRISSRQAPPRWATGWGTYGFAFVERVRMRQGMPKGKRPDGSLILSTRFHPWDVEELIRDIRAKKPDLTERCAILLMALREGYELRFNHKGRAYYWIDIDETRSLGPFPQPMGTWLRRAKAVEPNRKYQRAALTDYGKEVADDLLERRSSLVLGSAA